MIMMIRDLHMNSSLEFVVRNINKFKKENAVFVRLKKDNYSLCLLFGIQCFCNLTKYFFNIEMRKYFFPRKINMWIKWNINETDESIYYFFSELFLNVKEKTILKSSKY